MNPKQLPAGDEVPNKINVFIEIPSGGSTKYEVDEETGFLFVDRFLHTSMNYPFNYGFIPNTHAEDGDPLDVIVLSTDPAVPGSVVKCRPIGMLYMEDEAGMDEKLIAVPLAKIDPNYGEYDDIDDVSEATKNRIRHFFEQYKALEPNKWVKVKEWAGANVAKRVIEQGTKAG